MSTDYQPVMFNAGACHMYVMYRNNNSHQMVLVTGRKPSWRTEWGQFDQGPHVLSNEGCYLLHIRNIHSFPKETQYFWRCLSFGEESVCQWNWSYLTKSSRHCDRVSDPGAPGKMDRLKLRFFWWTVYICGVGYPLLFRYPFGVMKLNNQFYNDWSLIGFRMDPKYILYFYLQ